MKSIKEKVQRSVAAKLSKTNGRSPTNKKKISYVALPKEGHITITEGEFFKLFVPRRNDIKPVGAWGGCLFDTYGKEVAFVRRQDPATIWTLLEVDGNDEDDCRWVIFNGYHFVNRMGYFVTKMPLPNSLDVTVSPTLYR